MKILGKILVISSAILSLSSAANAITANASAKLLVPVTVSETTAMNFGEFTAPSTGSGTITSAGSVSGGVTAVTGISRSAGVFAVSGNNSKNYSFNIPANANLTRTGGTGTGNDLMVATLSFASGNASRTLDSNGLETVNISGSLAVASTNNPGTYTGTYTVTVNY